MTSERHNFIYLKQSCNKFNTIPLPCKKIKITIFLYCTKKSYKSTLVIYSWVLCQNAQYKDHITLDLYLKKLEFPIRKKGWLHFSLSFIFKLDKYFQFWSITFSSYFKYNEKPASTGQPLSWIKLFWGRINLYVYAYIPHIYINVCGGSSSNQVEVRKPKK